MEPIKSKRYESFGPWGGSGGGEWIYKPKGHITQIVLKMAKVIDSITFKHYNNSNKKLVENKFGGDGGYQVETINVNSPSEYLTSISGTVGFYRTKFFVVQSLCFITNLNKYGPFGNETGTAFSMPSLEGVAIVGFHGRSGRYIDSIGVCLKPINTCGPWGGSGGGNWTYKPEGQITQIVLKMGSAIDSITFKHYYNNNYRLVENKFGGNGGDRIVMININSPSEYLTSISGTVECFGKNWELVQSLSFVTNLNKYGPFGNNTGTAFSMPTCEGAAIVGFHGGAGTYLNSIGVYFKPISTEPNITSERYKSYGPRGGSGGGEWTYKPKGNITQIALKMSSTINSITFKHYDNNKKLVENKFGGDYGNQIETININSPSEYLTSINGTMGFYYTNYFVVRSLCFVTNLNKYGPFGTETDISFSMPTLEGAAIVGFHGQAGVYLDSIGVYFKPISTIRKRELRYNAASNILEDTDTLSTNAPF